MDAPRHILTRFRRMIDLEETADLRNDDLPSVVGHYRILRTLGSGASATVCEAEDLSLKRRVALKILKGVPENEAGRLFLARFHREAALAAGLRHPHIVTIHEVSMFRQPDGTSLHYIVMDCLPETLADRAAGRRLPPEEAARLVRTTARAIHQAHQKGIVHRDLKPANILLDDRGQPVVSDFGLAKEVAGGVQMTRSGAAVGTPLYMSPEQVSGRLREIGPATDVYALGVILFELLTGKPPFTGNTTGQVFACILRDEAPDPRASSRAIPADLAAICRRAMEKSPADRYGSAEAMAEDLDRLLDGRSVLAMKSNALSRFGRAIRRRPGWTAAALVALAAAAAVPLLVLRARSRAGEEAAEAAGRRMALYTRAQESLAAFLRIPKTGDRYAVARAETERAIGECIAAHPPGAEFLLLRIRFLMHDAQYFDAEPVLKEASGLAPEHPEIAYLAARVVLMNRIDLQSARRNQFARHGRLEPPPPPVGDDVLARYRSVASRLPAHRVSLIDGLQAAAEDQWTEAATHYEAFLAQEPGDVAVMQALATAYGLLGRTPEAVKVLDALLLTSPKSAFFRMRAEMHNRMREFAKALDDLGKAAQESDPNFHVVRSDSLLGLGRHAEAAEAASKSIALDPDHALAHIVRSRALRQAGKLEQALRDGNRAVELDGRQTRALRERAWVFHGLGRTAEAIRDLEAAMDLAKPRERAEILGNMAKMRHEVAGRRTTRAEQIPDYESAIKLANRANAEDPSVPDPYVVRALVRYDLHMATETMDRAALEGIRGDARKYLELSPTGGNAELARRIVAETERLMGAR